MRLLPIVVAFVVSVHARADCRPSSPEQGRGARVVALARASIRKKRYLEAVRFLESVSEKDAVYPRARVLLGFALYKADQLPRARTILREVLARPGEKGDPQHALRLADASFYSGMVAVAEAKSLTGDARRARLEQVVTTFRGFLRDHAERRAAWKERASFEMLRALVRLGRLREAEARYEAFRKGKPSSQSVAALLVLLFNARHQKAVERKARLTNTTDEEAQRAAVRRHRAEVRKAIGFAAAYAELLERPDYGLMRNASKLASSVTLWEEAAFFLEKILDAYGKDARYRDKLDTFIRSELAEVRMRQCRFEQALRHIRHARKARPKHAPFARTEARILGGWSTLGADGQARTFDGVGRFGEAYDLLWRQYGRSGKRFESWTLPWYRFHLECLDLAAKAGRRDAKLAESARRLFRIAKATDDFATLRGFGPEGKQLHALFLKLRPRF